MSKYCCQICGYIHNSISIAGCYPVPEKCPICGASNKSFILIQPKEMKISYYFKLFQCGWWVLHFVLCYTIERKSNE
ncbi:MAG: hypothetical protein HY934_10475 [Candidatus Firestonebacteria bacterium]|nr:hypothetical protein [Candidatus Firestonebacteria bacterium]